MASFCTTVTTSTMAAFFCLYQKNLDCSNFAGLRLTSFQSHPGYGEISRLLIMGKRGSGSLPPEWPSDHTSWPPKEQSTLMTILKGANSFLPQVVLAILHKVFCRMPSAIRGQSMWYYAPALGFLMFAVGVNSSEKDFLEAFSRPAAILAGYIGQFVKKPLLRYFFGTISWTIFGLPTSLAAGIMLTSCVSGAHLSNYAQFSYGSPNALCVGAPLAINVESLMSPYGTSVLLLVIAFHFLLPDFHSQFSFSVICLMSKLCRGHYPTRQLLLI